MSIDGSRRRYRELQSEDFQGLKRTKYDQERDSKSEHLQKAHSLFGIESLLYYNQQNNNSVNFLWKITFQKCFFQKNFVANDCHNDLPKEALIWEFQLCNNKTGNTNNSTNSMIFKITCKNINIKNKSIDDKCSKVIFNTNLKSLVKYEDDEPDEDLKEPEKANNICRQIEEYFENTDYHADVELNYCNLTKKTFNFKLRNIKVGSSLQKEILIPSEIFMKLMKEENIVLLLDITLVRNFSKFQNKSDSNFNYIGLINEGMTCYMNSMLQTLNVLGSFKKAVFQIPVKEEDIYSKNNIVVSFQRPFYDLMFDSNPVSTNRLIKSFGWGRDEMLIQHDVQEFNQLLSDMMDKKMKGTSVEGTFAKLFEGKLINYIECVNVDYQSKKKEKFLDLSLTVKGCKNLYDSFNKYIEIEILENENKYETETYGKQNARKGIKFLKFPNVLILQLKRFEYNPRKETMVKINDHFEFPETLDLTSYMCETTKHYNKDNLYTLHSIVVHRGSANSGHYYSFIRPGLEDFWLKFNDDFVRPANKYEVFNNNYGGILKQYKNKGRGEIVENNTLSEANAYILVYIKNTMRETILKPVTINDIPLYLKEKFDYEKREEVSRINSRQRLENNTNIIIFSKEMIIGRNNIGVQQCYFDTEENYPFFINSLSRFVLNFPKSIKLSILLDFISSQTNIPTELISLYIFEITFQNIVTRYNFNLLPLDLDMSIEEYTLKVKMAIPLILFVLVKDNNLCVFENKEILNESIKLDERLEIFMSRKINSWNFLRNNYKSSLTEKVKSENKVIFFKYINYDSKCLELVLDDVLYAPKDWSIAQLNKAFEPILKEKCKYYIKALKGITDSSFSISFLLEKRVNILDFNKMNNTELVENQTLLGSINEDCESMILIVNLKFSNINPFGIDLHSTKDLVEKLFLKYLANVYINIYNDCSITKEKTQKKHLFNIFDSEEKIKQNLLNIIKFDNNYKEVFNNNYYLNIKQNLITNDLLKKEVNVDYLELRSDKDPQILKDYPLVKYLTNPETSLFFHLSIFPKNEVIYSQIDFYLFDEDNNPIERVSVALPKRINTCKEITDFLYEPLLMKFYTSIVKEELYFILENPSTKVIYEVFRYGNDELFQYNGRDYMIEYRIQPFKRLLTCDYVDYSGSIKIFFSFLSKDGVSYDYPFCIFITKEISIKNFYEMIIEKMKSIKSMNEIDRSLIKIYKGKFTDFVEKIYVLSNPESEQSILTFFKEKHNFFNVVIELPIVLNLKNKIQ